MEQQEEGVAEPDQHAGIMCGGFSVALGQSLRLHFLILGERKKEKCITERAADILLVAEGFVLPEYN